MLKWYKNRKKEMEEFNSCPLEERIMVDHFIEDGQNHYEVYVDVMSLWRTVRCWFDDRDVFDNHYFVWMSNPVDRIKRYVKQYNEMIEKEQIPTKNSDVVSYTYQDFIKRANHDTIKPPPPPITRKEHPGTVEFVNKGNWSNG